MNFLLPADMVDRMARILLLERNSSFPNAEKLWDKLEPEDHESWRKVARVRLAELLAGCQVHEEEGLRLTWKDGTPDARGDQFDGNQPGWARGVVADPETANWQLRPTLISHLIITTTACEKTDA